MNVLQAAQDAGMAGWHVQTTLLGDRETILASNPTDQDDAFLFDPTKQKWVEVETGLLWGENDLPLCEYKELV